MQLCRLLQSLQMMLRKMKAVCLLDVLGSAFVQLCLASSHCVCGRQPNAYNACCQFAHFVVQERGLIVQPTLQPESLLRQANACRLAHAVVDRSSMWVKMVAGDMHGATSSNLDKHPASLGPLHAGLSHTHKARMHTHKA